MDRKFMLDSLVEARFKTAASIGALRQGVKRLGALKIPPNKLQSPLADAVNAGGFIPNQSIAKANTAKMFSAVPSESSLSPTSMMKHVEDSYSMIPKNLQGQILMPKGGPYRAAMKNPDLEGAVPRMSGEGQGAFNTMVNMHEGFERAVPKGYAGRVTSHLSPDVLMKEHNMLATATGPGAAEARAGMQQMRSAIGEPEMMDSLMQQYYGPRAAFTFGEGNKLPKALRRDFSKKFEANQIRNQAEMAKYVDKAQADMLSGNY